MGVVRYLGTNTVWAELQLQRVSSGLQRLSSGFLIFTKIPFQEKRSGMQNHNGCRVDSKADFRATDGSDRCCSQTPTGATVVLNSGIVYYVHGMEKWADNVDGKLVTTTGLIKTVAIAPAGIDASSASGADVCVIREIDWRLVSSEPEPVPPPPAPLGQPPVMIAVHLPAPGAINDDEHDERHNSPGNTRSCIGRIGKEAFSLLTHSSHDSKYDPSQGITMEHGSNASRP